MPEATRSPQNNTMLSLNVIDRSSSVRRSKVYILKYSNSVNFEKSYSPFEMSEDCYFLL